MINNLNRSEFMGYLGADAKQANSTRARYFLDCRLFTLD